MWKNKSTINNNFMKKPKTLREPETETVINEKYK